ncbi:MAG: FtsW/RodA/SpoVE family cell cycle protein [Streptosporangiaceae bacterium]
MSSALGQPRRRTSEEAEPAAGARVAAAPVSVDSARELAAGLRDSAGRLQALLNRPLASYYLVLGCTLLLLAVGLMMVLSTSTAEDLDIGLPPYSMFIKQCMGAAGGLVVMWLAARSRPRLFRALAYPMLLTGLAGLMAVLAFGVNIYGATRWLVIGGLQVQPSEFAKLALAVWGADLLARKEKFGQLSDSRQLLIPLLPVMAIFSMLVMLGDDLGTTFLMLVIFLALLWVIGTPGRLLAGMVGLMTFVVLMLIVVQPWRLDRISGFLAAMHPNCQTSACYQLIQGKYALGSGGLFGVGSGASRAKWGYVPNSWTDSIFAILGEELGLVGTLCVVLLYGGLGYAGLRIARRVTDTFSRLAAGAITVWLVAQAMVNIGAVLGILPITGVPLPLISYGESSLVTTMAALGMLMAFARTEPGAAQALAAAGPGLLRRTLGWLGLRRRLE